MKQLQLKDLYEACKAHMEAGNGDKYLIAANDNEGNGYHGVFYLITEVKPDDKHIEWLISDSNHPINELLIIG